MRTEMAKEDTMKIDSIRRAIRLAGLVLPLTWAPGSMAGQMRAAQAESFRVGVSTATVNQKAPSAALPAGCTSARVRDSAANPRRGRAGVGYVVFNERIPTGDGVRSSGSTVNMIHVVLQQLGLFGYETTGEIIVGSASSGVN